MNITMTDYLAQAKDLVCITNMTLTEAVMEVAPDVPTQIRLLTNSHLGNKINYRNTETLD